jgi:hypothetical protein
MGSQAPAASHISQERYVSDFDFRTQVECVVSRAALPQGLQLHGLPTVWPVARPRVRGEGDERQA